MPRVVAIGGSTRPGSSSESALAVAAGAARAAGADVEIIVGRRLIMPIYDTETGERSAEALALLKALSRADALIVAAPGYHGSISGMIKNALDYVEDLREGDRVYLDGLAVGCIGVAYGWQAAVNTLGTLRTIVHALRGWPTPLGVSVNSSLPVFDGEGNCVDEGVAGALEQVGEQVVDFARSRPVGSVR